MAAIFWCEFIARYYDWRWGIKYISEPSTIYQIISIIIHGLIFWVAWRKLGLHSFIFSISHSKKSYKDNKKSVEALISLGTAYFITFIINLINFTLNMLYNLGLSSIIILSSFSCIIIIIGLRILYTENQSPK